MLTYITKENFILFFGILAILSSIFVITDNNPVHSVFYLVLSFCNCASIFIILGVEFIALTLIIVYVGAIAILFLFVVMMLNIRLIELYSNLTRFFPFTIVFAIIFTSHLLFFQYSTEISNLNFFNWDLLFFFFTHTHNIGHVLYTSFFLYFLLSAYILLLAMVGAISLTLYKHHNIYRQNTYIQTSRHFLNSVSV